MNSTLNISYDGAFIVGEAFGYYLIPITAFTSGFLRVLFAIHLWNSKLLKNPKYLILLYKIVIICIDNLTYIGYQNNACKFCPERLFNTYWSQVYQLYILGWAVDVLRFQINLFEILITYDRLIVLRQHQNAISKKSIKYFYLITLLIAFSIHCVPDYFATFIDFSPSHDSYFISETSFGSSESFLLFKIIHDPLIRIAVISVLIIINTLNVIEYKRFIKQKARIVKNKNFIHAETIFTKMVIIETSLFSFALFNIGWPNILFAVNASTGIFYNSFNNLIILISEEFMLLVFISDLVIYFALDKNLKKTFDKKLRFLKTIINLKNKN